MCAWPFCLILDELLVNLPCPSVNVLGLQAVTERDGGMVEERYSVKLSEIDGHPVWIPMVRPWTRPDNEVVCWPASSM